MLSKRKWLGIAGAGAIALCCAPALSLTPDSRAAAPAGGIEAAMPAQGSARNAALTFLNALARGDAESVWIFASEEEHDAFQTEQVAFAAYADAFPALTRAKRVEVVRAWQEGDTPFFELAVTDTGGERYRATLGLWRDDAGDWKIVSAAVVALSDRVASR